MNKLSIVIIAKDEEKNIPRCLNSVKKADEIIVLDTGSSDYTEKIARDNGAVVYKLKEWKGFGLAKREAVSYASNEWIFSIDADEVATKELMDKIRTILKDPQHNIYKIKRNSFYLGKMIKHSGWDKDYPKRLFNKSHANFNDKLVHESVECNDKPAVIEEILLHYTYPDLGSHIKKINYYTDLAVLQSPSRKTSIAGACFAAIVFFLKMYIVKKGFLDGKEGLVLSLVSSWGTLIKYLKFWDNSRKKSE